MYIVLARL